MIVRHKPANIIMTVTINKQQSPYQKLSGIIEAQITI